MIPRGPAALLLALAVLVGTVRPAPAAPDTPSPPSPCSGSEWKQLDFWVGEWGASWPASPGTPAGRPRAISGCWLRPGHPGRKGDQPHREDPRRLRGFGKFRGRRARAPRRKELVDLRRAHEEVAPDVGR